MVNNRNMASVEQNRQQDDRDHSAQIISQVLQATSKTEGANSQNLFPTPQERTDHERLSRETKQRSFNETVFTQCTDGSSESKLNSCVCKEKQMQRKITNAQVKLNLSDDETRLVNGLLTTTLCSTEL